jgi:CheY-like chemotaxis protein
MDGYEATRRIREWEVENCEMCQATQETEPKMECETVRACPHCRLPVVAVTADVMKGTHELCFSAGMDDYIPKVLLTAIFSWIYLMYPFVAWKKLS